MLGYLRVGGSTGCSGPPPDRRSRSTFLIFYLRGGGAGIKINASAEGTRAHGLQKPRDADRTRGIILNQAIGIFKKINKFENYKLQTIIFVNSCKPILYYNQFTFDRFQKRILQD